MSGEDIRTIRTKIENGNIRDQRGVDSWIEKHSDKQGYYSSDKIDAEDRRSNDDYAGLGSQTSQGESGRGQGNQDSAENLGTGQVKTGWDGSTNPRYVDKSDIQEFTTPDGEMYLDETVITSEHPMHEYTHLWNRAVKRSRPRL